MIRTRLAEERAEHRLAAISELGSCAVLLPQLSAGGPWSLTVFFSP